MLKYFIVLSIIFSFCINNSFASLLDAELNMSKDQILQLTNPENCEVNSDGLSGNQIIFCKIEKEDKIAFAISILFYGKVIYLYIFDINFNKEEIKLSMNIKRRLADNIDDELLTLIKMYENMMVSNYTIYIEEINNIDCNQEEDYNKCIKGKEAFKNALNNVNYL